MMKRNALLTTTAVALAFATSNPVHATHDNEELYTLMFAGKVRNEGSSGNYNCFMPAEVEVIGRFTYDRNQPTYVESGGVGAEGRSMYDIDGSIVTSESWLYEGNPPALLVGEAHLILDNDRGFDGQWIDRMHFTLLRTQPIGEFETFIMHYAHVIFTNRTNTPSDDALESLLPPTSTVNMWEFGETEIAVSFYSVQNRPVDMGSCSFVGEVHDVWISHFNLDDGGGGNGGGDNGGGSGENGGGGGENGGGGNNGGVLLAACSGFAEPMDVPVRLRPKSNRVLPLRMILHDEDGFLLTPEDIEPPVVSVRFTNTLPEEEVAELAQSGGRFDTGNQFRWDETAQEWVFNLSSTSFSNLGTYVIRVEAGSEGYLITDACMGTFMRQ
jgi:hypothetical protein